MPADDDELIRHLEAEMDPRVEERIERLEQLRAIKEELFMFGGMTVAVVGLAMYLFLCGWIVWMVLK